MELYLQRSVGMLGEKIVALLNCEKRILDGLSWTFTSASMMIGNNNSV